MNFSFWLFYVFFTVPILLNIFPRYLYLFASSKVLFPRVIVVGMLFPILITLHFGAPNSLWCLLLCHLWCSSSFVVLFLLHGSNDGSFVEIYMTYM